MNRLLLLPTLTLLAGISIGCSNANEPSKDKWHLVFDGGSSGTKPLLFRSTTDSQNRLTIVGPGLSGKNAFKCPKNEDRGGIHNFIDKDNDTIRDGLDTYFDAALTCVSTYLEGVVEKSQVEVYLRATAGVRANLNQIQQEILWNKVNAVLATKGFDFKNAATLLGKDEGVNAWIDVNLILGNFNDPSASGNTRGMLEMGGQSLQVVFEPSEPMPEGRLEKYSEKLTIFGNDFTVYTYSYNNLGINAAKDMFLNGTTNGDGTLRDPATPILKCQPGIESEYNACRAAIAIDDRFDPIINGAGTTTGLEGRYQPTITGTWIALGLFANDAGNYDLQNMTPTQLGFASTLGRKNINEKYIKLCGVTAAQIKENYGVPVKFAINSCFEMSFIGAVLSGNRQADREIKPSRKGLLFPLDTELILAEKEIPVEGGKKEPTWAAGFLFRTLSKT